MASDYAERAARLHGKLHGEDYGNCFVQNCYECALIARALEQSALEAIKELGVEAMIQQAHDVAQVIEGWRNTTPDNEWSEYDQSAREGIGKLLEKLYDLRARLAELRPEQEGKDAK